MVQIVYDATKKNDTPRTAQCRHCKSLLSFRPSEAKPVPDSRDGDALVFKCPCCQKDVWVSETAHYRRMEAGY